MPASYIAGSGLGRAIPRDAWAPVPQSRYRRRIGALERASWQSAGARQVISKNINKIKYLYKNYGSAEQRGKAVAVRGLAGIGGNDYALPLITPAPA
jgi:hypothetical protein